MTSPDPGPTGPVARRSELGRWFDLASDQATPPEIDASIRANVAFQGTQLWILICAVFVASIGLNVNSAAVIIGAMLISPLMGPIMAIGYGAGVNDFALIRVATKNLAIAVLFSLLTSTVYFMITPLSGARSELLARTSPAIWDVLIAIFGGLAGIIGSTRRQKGNVIPGVAIATALMPPLCTAGYGIATLQPYLALGALYLFAINSVFIATATLGMVRIMGLPEVTRLDVAVRTRTRRAIGAVVLMTGVPTVYLAYGLVQQEVFTNRAETFIAETLSSDRGTFVVGKVLDPAKRVLRVHVVGEAVTEEARLAMEQSLDTFGLVGARLEIVQARPGEALDIEALREQLGTELRRSTLTALEEKNLRISDLEEQLENAARSRSEYAAIGAEIAASYPQATHLAVGTGTTLGADGAQGEALLVTLTVRDALSQADRTRL
ncbi:MAG: DUF389 domain-containing protein, partial [Deltaproteobacteria bacterium]|nr:DUF389 domain-containing protein [Deltaproteobacteria bacterium]